MAIFGVTGDLQHILWEVLTYPNNSAEAHRGSCLSHTFFFGSPYSRTQRKEKGWARGRRTSLLGEVKGQQPPHALLGSVHSRCICVELNSSLIINMFTTCTLHAPFSYLATTLYYFHILFIRPRLSVNTEAFGMIKSITKIVVTLWCKFISSTVSVWAWLWI